MPYTPPGTSPNSCSLTSSRSPSFSSSQNVAPMTLASGVPSGPVTATTLPRSASFLAKHRRSPALEKPVDVEVAMPAVDNGHHHHRRTHSHPPRTANSTEGTVKLSTSVRSSGSLHQAPLPKNHGSNIPAGAVISPPDSTQNSSDEDSPVMSGRGRQLDHDNIKELKIAIRESLPQHRESSPPRFKPARRQDKIDARPDSLAPAAADFAHSRSSSESSLVEMGRDYGSDDSDMDDDEARRAPPMVRKKSGELVKSSLKSPGGRRRPNSMPSTPTFPKAVHFDSHLEHVRTFRQAEKPLAVSAGSSPVEAFESESEYPFPTQEGGYITPPFEWELVLANFPTDRQSRSMQNVCVERLFLSSNNQNLVGTISVRNISFQKWVVARFTTDYWKTTSEVVAEFSQDFRRKTPLDENRDYFTFTIKLAEVANLENKILFLCARYNVNGQEFWDNNNNMNFQVEFKKKHVPQLGKNGPKQAALPRSGGRAAQLAQRPRSMPVFDADFDAFDGKGTAFDFSPISAVVGDSPEKPKKEPKVKLNAKDSSARRVNPSNNVFGNRYDFGASLNAAIQAANATLGVRSGLPQTTTADAQTPYFAGDAAESKEAAEGKARFESGKPLSAHHRSLSFPVHKQPRSTTPTGTPPVEEAKFRLPTFDEKPSIQSSSYQEILEKMCFYGSPQVVGHEIRASTKPQTSPEYDQVLNTSPNKPQYLGVNFVLGSDSRSPSPSPLIRSPLVNTELAAGFSQSSSPPSLVASQRSSGAPSPMQSTAAYTYGSRYLDGYGLERSHTPTAIRS